MLLAVLLGGCTGYSRGERYLCFSPFEPQRCKQPPYHFPAHQVPEARTKDDAILP